MLDSRAYWTYPLTGAGIMSPLYSKGRVWIFVALWAAAIPATAQEPWGYLWELGTARLHPLRGDSIKIGRLPASDVVLSDPRVSRRHAEISRSPEGAVVLDRGSTNGTYLNGEALPVGEGHVLHPGSILTVAFERLLYHEDEGKLWQDVLRHSLLGSLVELRVPVLADRKVKALGQERLVEAVSRASVDSEKMAVQMQYPDDAVREQEVFQPKEWALVGDVDIREGEVRLSLWGLARGGSLVSRRASLDHLKHGELRVGLAAASPREARNVFEERWKSEGAPFLLSLLGGVCGLSNREGLAVALKLTRSLIDQEGPTAPRDAARSLDLLQHYDPNNPDIPVLAARAEALWVKRVLDELRGSPTEADRQGLTGALDRAKKWLERASKLDASKKDIESAEAEIAEAEKRMTG